MMKVLLLMLLAICEMGWAEPRDLLDGKVTKLTPSEPSWHNFRTNEEVLVTERIPGKQIELQFRSGVLQFEVKPVSSGKFQILKLVVMEKMESKEYSCKGSILAGSGKVTVNAGSSKLGNFVIEVK